MCDLMNVSLIFTLLLAKGVGLVWILEQMSLQSSLVSATEGLYLQGPHVPGTGGPKNKCLAIIINFLLNLSLMIP